MSAYLIYKIWYKFAILYTLCLVKVNSIRYLNRVIQGSPTSISDYPVLAQLLLDPWGSQQYMQHCAGVILTSRHVMSAAHCFQYNANTRRSYSNPKYWKIRVGSSYRNRGGVIHDMKLIIPHPDFDKVYYTNDIAIVVASKQFIFNNNVKQSTIIKQDVEIKPDSICQLAGWGVLEPGGPQPDLLQHTTLTTIDTKICNYRYSTIGALVQEDSMMCAGRLDMTGPDGCYGDSGGPLIYKGLVVGLVSFGYSCGHRYFPGVYTKVSHYTNWVVDTVNNNK